MRDKVPQLRGWEGTIPKQLALVTDKEVFIAIALAPNTTQIVSAAEYAATRGCPLIAFTDHRLSPLATASRLAVFVAAERPLLNSSMTALTPIFQTLIAAVAKSLRSPAPPSSSTSNTTLEAFGTPLPVNQFPCPHTEPSRDTWRRSQKRHL